jgi:hypothetical protein
VTTYPRCSKLELVGEKADGFARLVPVSRRGEHPRQGQRGLFENLEDGMTVDEVVEQFPVTREQLKAVLEFAARSLDAPVPGR